MANGEISAVVQAADDPIQPPRVNQQGLKTIAQAIIKAESYEDLHRMLVKEGESCEY
ncbi:MAG: hypothetical protein ACTSW1_17565 [Candidatus Hodarchaeales archaeon]